MASKKVKKVARTPKKSVTKSPWLILGLLVIIFIGILMMKMEAKPALPSTSTPPAVQTLSFDFNNEVITLDGQELRFTNGSYKSTDGAHVAMMMNRSVNPAGNRAAAIMMDNPGGSGSFYYIVGAMNKNGIETFSAPVVLGDRIQIVSVTVEDPQAEDNGEIIVEYLTRPADAPMSSDPTEKMTAKFSFQDDGNLIPVLN